MSIEKLSQTPAGTTDFTDLKKEVTKNAKGIAQITVSEYDTDASCVVKVGSVFENNGATFIVSGTDETPTGYAGIAVSTTFYLYFHYDSVTPANSEFQYSSTAPVWNDALQGWYNGNDRAFFSMYKDSTGLLYEEKERYCGVVNNKIISRNVVSANNDGVYVQEMNGSQIITELIEIGSWDMDTDATKLVYLGGLVASVVSISGVIRPDTTATSYILGSKNSSTSNMDVWIANTIVNGSIVGLSRTTGGFFDGGGFDDDTVNRGYLLVTYVK